MTTALRLLGLLWSLPVTLLGLLVAPVCRPFRARREGLALALHVRWLWWRVSAVTLGHVILYRLAGGAPRAHLRRHEHVHVLQCDLLGPLMLVAYPLASLVARLGGGDAYHDNLFERWARGEWPRPARSL